MNIVHNIQLQEKSIDYLNKVFDQYTEVEFSSSKIIQSPIVHMYPTEDTRRDDGELSGYVDAMLFTLKIYDTQDKVFMETHNKDALDLYDDNIKIRKIKIFKDGSTMVQFNGDYNFYDSQAVEVLRRK